MLNLIATALTAAAAGKSLLPGGGQRAGRNQNAFSQSFSSPLGNIIYNNGQMAYTPRIPKAQRKANHQQDLGILKATKFLNKPFSLQNYYNNPFYGNTLDMLNRPLQQQKSHDEREMMNRLNAQNQIGSSYDAYQRHLLQQRYDNLFQENKNQARQASANAYQSQIDNALATLTGLRRDRLSALEAAYMPTRMASFFR